MKKKGWRSKQLGRAKTGFPVYVRTRKKTTLVDTMKDKLIKFIFSKGGVALTRLMTTLGTGMAGWFELSEKDTEGMVSALVALVGFIVIGVRGKIKAKFVKRYQEKNGLVPDAAPLIKTTTHLEES